MALEAADRAGERAASAQGSVLNATRDILNDQVNAVKGLAESLKLGDEKTAKLITLAIIAAIVVIAIFFIWKG
jgi:1,4-dihydroxy-2-naphthoate octaprenyltransferase